MYSRLIMSMHVELSPIDTVVQHALPPAREQGFPFFRTQAELVGNAICDIRDALLVWFQFGPKALDLIEHGREPSFNGGKRGGRDPSSPLRPAASAAFSGLQVRRSSGTRTPNPADPRIGSLRYAAGSAKNAGQDPCTRHRRPRACCLAPARDGELPVRLCNYTDVYKNDYITDDLEFMRATASRAEIAKFDFTSAT